MSSELPAVPATPVGRDSGLGYQVYRPVLPASCRKSPGLMVLAGDVDGRCEVFAWDAATGAARQVTDRPEGTLLYAVDADAVIWWFDEEPDGRGTWRTQPFAGGPDTPGLTGTGSGRPCGLAVNDSGTVALGLGDEHGLRVHLGPRGGAGREVLRTDGHGLLVDLAPAGDLLAVARGAATKDAVTLLTPDGTVLETLPGTDGRLWALGFAPGSTTPELLLVAERDGRYVIGTWRADTGLELHRWCAFDTEITARWYPQGRTVLVRQDRHGRSRLVTADLDRRERAPVAVPAGTVLDAAPQPGGDVHYLWTDTLTPPRTRSLLGAPLPGLEAEPPPIAGRAEDVWTPGPDGPVHTLLTVPSGAKGPHPLVLLVHGGPAAHDRDAYDPAVHSLVESGFAVARVNYRGSTGYGPRWRAAYGQGVGLTQVADLALVRADLLRRGVARADAIGLWGTSWGGYLVLLALGTRPDLWQAAVAVKPLADCAQAFAAGTPALRALDTELFGGTPEQIPDVYARSSPSSYVASVRAPLLVVAATQDAKCPPEQVETYLAALRACGVPHDALWLDGGHDGNDGGDHVQVLHRSLVFLDRHLRGPRRPPRTAHDELPAPSGAGARGPAASAAGPARRNAERR
ncbi:alpha/beta fold hydrolase [Streptomyces sp. NPDC006733]|uniref:S9 family peptidase n=1 Tax=Streptomyces sp. NPDC006733 TaxID=3155460 RepID=UPI0033C43E39